MIQVTSIIPTLSIWSEIKKKKLKKYPKSQNIQFMVIESNISASESLILDTLIDQPTICSVSIE